ncbi:MAG: hypothetical protein CMH27_07480 [Micavibrio sp.]|nr:hypothetical protein [Micavibrio sp.]|tara:strand:- start:937 stop:2052 length:1116 start_codon:yes stop_codon:yes gene_type:complete
MSIRTEHISQYNITYDLVRGVAALVVFVLHFKPLVLFALSGDIPPVNYFDKTVLLLAVEFFFALSGLLLGRVLLDILSKHDAPAQSLWVFVRRRLYRTLPAYYAALLVFCQVYAYAGDAYPDNLAHYFFFLQNVNGFHHEFFAVSWSLSIEEIFYLSFALALLPVLWLPVSPLTRLRVVIVGFIVCVAAIRFVDLLDFEYWYSDVSLAALSRLDCIALGMLVMTYCRGRVPVWAFALAMATILAALCYWSISWQNITPGVMHITILNLLYLAVPLSCAVLIQYWSQTLTIRLRKIIIFLADISYPLYVFHMVGFYCLVSFSSDLSLWLVLSVMAVCVLFSAAFHRFIEQPVMKRRPQYRDVNTKRYCEGHS